MDNNNSNNHVENQDNLTISKDDLCGVISEAAELVHEKHLGGQEALEAALRSHEKTLELRRARQEELEAAAVADVEKHIPESERGVTVHQTPRTVKLVKRLPGVNYIGGCLSEEGTK